ncbi:glutathione S-transferase C-terminal-like protein [Panaeolus papilionaceus]|nr:glutathione S-transferase C-terminal-like protein [Panaeolus papilionaceus]
MASMGTLWTVSDQSSGKIIRSAAALGGVHIDLPSSYEHYVDNLKPEFLAKFPHGKIPAWEGANGFKLFEGVAIARYICSLAPSSGLLGHSSEDDAHIDQWVHLVDTEVDAHTTSILRLVYGQGPYNKPTHTTLLERQLRSLKSLNAHLKSNTFFVGERITLADLFVAGLFQRAVESTVSANARALLVYLMRHFETITQHPQLKDIFGETKFTEKGVEYIPPTKEKKGK